MSLFDTIKSFFPLKLTEDQKATILHTTSNLNVVDAVKQIQKETGLEPTGKVDAATYRRVNTETLAHEIDKGPKVSQTVTSSPGHSTIIVDGKHVPIEWGRVVRFSDSNGLAFKSNKTVTNGRTIDGVITHWDVCLSAKSCWQVLQPPRQASTHFCIDNDGTIYQFMDTKDVAWHSGIGSVNKRTIGVDLSNAVYEKYNPTYEKMGFGSRPVLNSMVHGKPLRHLGWYPAQIDAYKALLACLSDSVGVRLQYPTDKDGGLLKRFDASCVNFKGVQNHYNIRADKIDCAGLPLDEIIKSIRK